MNNERGSSHLARRQAHADHMFPSTLPSPCTAAAAAANGNRAGAPTQPPLFYSLSTHKGREKRK